MKIAIIGLSGSGKTTLASIISSTYGIPCLHIDEVMFRFLGHKKRKRIPSRVYIPKIHSFIRKNDWIVEGMFPFKSVFQRADYIIWMQPPLWLLLLQQWKRYCVDPQQRQRYGFISNLNLSYFNIQLQLGVRSIKFADDKPRITLNQLEKLLHGFSRKLIIMADHSQKRAFLKLLAKKRKKEL